MIQSGLHRGGYFRHFDSPRQIARSH